MKILFYFSSNEGHNIEYFSHLYKKALTEKQTDFVFVFPDNEHINELLATLPRSNNIEVSLFNDKQTRSSNKYLHQYYFVKQLIKTYNPTDFFFVYLMQNIFSMFFLSFKKVRFHGIIYNIFLRVRKCFFSGIIKYLIFRFTANLKSVYILNDELSVKTLKCYYLSRKFKYLTDPIQPKIFTDSAIVNYAETPIKIVFLGMLSERKGLLLLFDLIRRLTKSQIVNFEFLMAGVLDNKVRDLYNIFLQENHSIAKFEEGFLSYETFHKYIKESHFVILPYQRVAQSSGLVGMAASYQKPLLYPNSGLIGEICDDYSLGFPMKMEVGEVYDFLVSNNSQELFEYYCKNNKAGSYEENCSVETFTSTIFCNFVE